MKPVIVTSLLGVFLQQVIVETAFNLFCSVNLIQRGVSKQKKEHPVKRTRSSVILTTHTVHLDRPRSPGVGRNCVLRGTCHMLSESGLKQKPVNASRTASQPGSQTLSREGEGSRG